MRYKVKIKSIFQNYEKNSESWEKNSELWENKLELWDTILDFFIVVERSLET